MRTLRVAQVACDDAAPIDALLAQLGPGPFALVCLYVSPQADFAALNRAAQGRFGAAEVLAGTTAGEIGTHGYEEAQVIAVGFPAALFCVDCYAIDDLDQLDAQSTIDAVIHRRVALAQRAPRMVSEFACLMVDGLSMQEENLASVLSSGMGAMPLFGGSTGDGTEFTTTWLSYNGNIRRNAAVIALVRSHCPVQVFSLDHLVPTEVRMVVTRADPSRRLVHEINAEPAAAEYARLLGKDPLQLDAFTFAAHPVVVRLGDSHHVRSIKLVDDDGNLHFFSAINEGMVLTLAEHQDMAEHLEAGLSALSRDQAPDRILGCDCLLRRTEAGQFQKTRQISDILARHRVVGFNTYGEQFGGLHVNQTLTGVAIYPPLETDAG